MADDFVFVPWDRETADLIVATLKWTPEETAERLVIAEPRKVELGKDRATEHRGVGYRLTKAEHAQCFSEAT